MSLQSRSIAQNAAQPLRSFSLIRQQPVNSIEVTLEALERGESLDKEKLQAEYPEFSEELGKFLADRDRLVKMASSVRNGIDGIASDPIAPTITSHSQVAPLAAGTSVRYFGDYELLEEIARGGMGIVYKARQVSLNRIVAVKMILAGQLASEDDVKRFHTDAEAAANLDHPGIVPIYEVGQHEGLHYFSMGFVDGESLARKLADGPLAVRQAAELTKEVALAVHYAHQQGVIHRDLKPANVLLDDDGQPRITDFGLAKRVDVDSSITTTGQILGTPSFMPPEQAGGNLDQVAETSDVYSLGAILYAALTGRPPFQADNVIDTLTQVMEQEPVGPCQLTPKLPRDLETICLKCLQKESHQRYASAQELTDELQRFLKGEPIKARPIGALKRTAKWARRRPAIAALCTTLVVVTVLGFLGVYSQWQKTEAALKLAEKERIAEITAHAPKLEHRLILNHNDAVVSVVFSKDGRHALTASQDKTAVIWDTRTGEEIATLEGHDGVLSSARFSPDGQRILTVSYDSTAKYSYVNPVGEGRGGERPLKYGDESVRIWDATTGQQLRVLKGHKGQVTDAAFSPDGKRVVTSSYDQTARVWDVESITAVPPL